ncbi:hypothetical protein T440DRAFT_468871 [Plenodomus tracheiphilus IPT5]|uniref:F-box domain-containing protein n=1 Tax=Plenodomus tracheiphilus IPT5 TaxID=1408161 RepID=A0A6A7B4I0_9PLEO|nr:hypothetical protein T440DRAFT_468871 [Plenodomus tracheiphilus IPT5]
MSSPIANLPVELFDLLAAHLDLLSFSNLRLCSRRLHLLSLTPFANQYFSRLTTSLGSASLDRLVQVAQHHHFSKAVAGLHVRFLYHADYCHLETIARLGIYPPPKRFAVPSMPGITSRNIPTESTLYKDVSGHMYPKCIVDRLARALHSFRNIQTVKFYTRLNHNGDDQVPCDRDNIFRIRCFQAVIAAITQSKIELRQLSVSKGSRTRPLHRSLRLPYTALHLPRETLQALQPRLSKLTSLTLSIDALHRTPCRPLGWEQTLSNVIALAPSLTELVLSLGHHDSITQHSLGMMHSLALFGQALSLKYLVLSDCNVHEEDLTMLLTAQAASLRQLELSDVRICSGSWNSVITGCKTLETLERLQMAMLKGPNGQYLTLSHRRASFLKVTLGAHKENKTMSEQINDLLTFGTLHWDP